VREASASSATGQDGNNHRAAIDAWERYLQRVTSIDDAEAKEVRRLLRGYRRTRNSNLDSGARVRV
jgi:hypothetical protein